MPRIAILDREKCKPEKCSLECQRFCPGVRVGEETIVLDEEEIPLISEELCTGCGICVHKCPFEAINIINLPEELEGRCIHRYGPNRFALYELPIPRYGKVTGLVGRNGIGKTTALNLLSGEFTPNLGGEEPASGADLNEFFKGSELQAYFSEIGEVNISYKPQRIANLPSVVKGKVGELLTSIDERGKSGELIRELDLEEVKNHKVENLSGGELQRLGIAAAVAKEADLYYFDEPSSHLDIYQRLNAARVIRRLAKGDKAVIIVEHDLAALDYMCDYVHVMYGTPSAYGVVSEPRGVRVGINTFLNGYLKEENIRFRDESIRFETRAPKKAREVGVPSFDFPKLMKRFKGFKLEVQEGKVFAGEIVGIVGPNAIGKTTFVRMLAGDLKPTQGEIEKELEVAYKPQYPKFDGKGTVRNYLKSHLPEFNQDVKVEVLEPLGVDELLEADTTALSGGQRQRVEISRCLGQPADLYLLDEPSAYLDVEQRLSMARALSRIIDDREATAFVVDHDVLTIDYLSNRLLVFHGEPGRKGATRGPLEMREGMNSFLQEVGITFRRDPHTGRPRVNKPGSRMDREQKEQGEYYYTG
ncbi:ATPase [candidate division MSBL1 archaeon SCGC-AAA261O19]|uniref:ATPase n=1 Tax=candidate division MSBL1 archaeon SCGC-AAA261O19 TaxID=1698277 RepID=A0A133VEX6_9EURY|nr:ATPase [candidate division MSBL1 archaeon SCGC-AAA261O19]